MGLGMAAPTQPGLHGIWMRDQLGNRGRRGLRFWDHEHVLQKKLGLSAVWDGHKQIMNPPKEVGWGSRMPGQRENWWPCLQCYIASLPAHRNICPWFLGLSPRAASRSSTPFARNFNICVLLKIIIAMQTWVGGWSSEGSEAPIQLTSLI